MQGVNTFQRSASSLIYVHQIFVMPPHPSQATECLEEARGRQFHLIYEEESVDLSNQKQFG